MRGGGEDRGGARNESICPSNLVVVRCRRRANRHVQFSVQFSRPLFCLPLSAEDFDTKIDFAQGKVVNESQM